MSAGTNFGLYCTFWDRLMGTEDTSYYAAFAQAAGNGKAARADLVG